jgi:hypothetical protein
MWLLIVTMIGYGNTSVFSNAIEFTTKETCLAARERIVIHPRNDTAVDAFCTKK